jgi:hypothetical protein
VRRACVVDSKLHIRNFLREALDDLGFITCEYAAPTGLKSIVMEQRPDLLVIGLSGGGIAANGMLEVLAALNFPGHILVFGPHTSPMVTAILSIGVRLGLAMLPLLPTPFSDDDLRNSVALLLPDEAPPTFRSTSQKRFTQIGLNCGTSRKLKSARSSWPAPARSYACVTRPGE